MKTVSLASALSVITLCAVFCVSAAFADTAGEKEKVSAVLDTLHQSAAKADGEKYFSLYTDDAIFLGTDAAERWTMEQMKEWAIPYFKKGKGWDYKMVERYIYLSADGKTAWFDEKLLNEKYGDCRGSGALIKAGEEWKITQYNLTVPVPNSLLLEVVALIRKEAEEGKKDKKDTKEE